MTLKQKIARWMKYHGGSTIILLIFSIIACLGGLDLESKYLLLILILSAIIIWSIETIFWKVVIWIMGRKAVAVFLNDPWLNNK